MFIVTGGAGFIGSNIAARLAARADAHVVVVDRLRDAASGKWRNIAKHPICDIVHPDELFGFLDANWRRVEAVIHLGAISATTETDVDRIVETNLRLSTRLWDWCVGKQRRLIYASSAATYGGGETGFVDVNDIEAVARLRPLNAYGWSKKAFDLYALRSASRGEAPPAWAGLRFFNVYGPNEGHKGAQKSVVAHMAPKIQAGESVRLYRSHHPEYADGGQLRDFVYVRDCVDVVEWLVEADRQAGIVNVGSGAARSFADLAMATFKAFGAKPRIDYIDTPEAIRANYQYFTQADLTRLRSLGYERQFTPLEAGVGDYVQFFLSQADPYA